MGSLKEAEKKKDEAATALKAAKAERDELEQKFKDAGTLYKRLEASANGNKTAKAAAEKAVQAVAEKLSSATNKMNDAATAMRESHSQLKSGLEMASGMLEKLPALKPKWWNGQDLRNREKNKERRKQ